MIKTLMSYIPSNNMQETPRRECTDPIDRLDDSLNEIIPEDPNQAYDMYQVISAIVDDGEFLEVQPRFAKNIIIGFARFNGQSVGIVANQPSAYAGVLDVNASRKGARFVRFCDAFNIPIVSLVDVPGFLPGTGQEYNAVILHGAKLLYAYGEATVPKVTVTLRKSYGGSHIVMGCKQLRADINYACLLLKLPLWAQLVPLQYCRLKVLSKSKKKVVMYRHFSLRRKLNIPSSLPILIRLQNMVTSMM